MTIRAMIMAAGAGTRLEPLTQSKPKPMVPLGNLPIMEHTLNLLRDHGITEIIFNTHHLGQQICDYFIDNKKFSDLNLSCIEEPELSGTAGGVKKAEDFLKEADTILVMSGDGLTDVNITELIEKHNNAGGIASMGLFPVEKEQVKHFGVVIKDKNNLVTDFQEKPDPSEAKSTLINTGIYVFNAEIFNYIPENTFYDFAKQVFPAVMQDNKGLYGFEINCYWNDIGTLEQYLQTSFDILHGNTSIKIPLEKFDQGWKAVNCEISPKATLKNKVMIGENTIIKAGVQARGNVTIGNDCLIFEDTSIEDCLIWEGTTIGKNNTIQKAIIGKNVIIGDNVTIEEGSVIASDCSIPPGTAIKAGTKLTQDVAYSG